MLPNELHICRWGLSGPRVVMVHGSAQGSRVGGADQFSAQEILAKEGWQLLVPDRPGHGRTPSNGAPDDAALDGAWVSELLADAGHLVGHSFGGCVALDAAARRPDAVRSLTLIEPGMQKLATDIASVRQFGLRLMATKFLSLSAASRAQKFAKLVGIPSEIGGSKSKAELTRMGQGIVRMRIPSEPVLRQQLFVLRQRGTPLLVVSGGWSPAFEATADRVALLGGGQRLIIPSPHHFPNLVPSEFNNLLDVFLRAAEKRERLI